MTKSQSGFTLIELLIVLCTVQLFLYFGIVHVEKTSDKLAFERWYKQFETDVLYLQKRSGLSLNRPYLQFNLQTNEYMLIINKTDPPLFYRPVPNDWKITFATTENKLAFNNNGQFLTPGVIKIDTLYYDFSIVFPFGKGRCYVTHKKR